MWMAMWYGIQPRLLRMWRTSSDQIITAAAAAPAGVAAEAAAAAEVSAAAAQDMADITMVGLSSRSRAAVPDIRCTTSSSNFAPARAAATKISQQGNSTYRLPCCPTARARRS